MSYYGSGGTLTLIENAPLIIHCSVQFHGAWHMFMYTYNTMKYNTIPERYQCQVDRHPQPPCRLCGRCVGVPQIHTPGEVLACFVCKLV